MSSDQVLCIFKNLSVYPDGSRILARNLNFYFKTNDFIGLQQLDSKNDTYEITRSKSEAIWIRSNLADILTTQHRSIWFSYEPIFNLYSNNSSIRTSASNAVTDSGWTVICNFGTMVSYDTFQSHYDDPHSFRLEIQYIQRRCQSMISLINKSSRIRMNISFNSVQSDILIKLVNDERDERVSVILMLTNPPNMFDQDSNGHCSRMTDNFSSKKCGKVVSLSSDLHLQFLSRRDAWDFLKKLPKRSNDKKFNLNFAEFEIKLVPGQDTGPINSGIEDSSSLHGRYGLDMLMSLGYLFEDKYFKDAQLQKQILDYRKRDERKFYNFSCELWTRLKQNHCCSIERVFQEHQASSVTHVKLATAYEVPHMIVTPSRILLQPLHVAEENRALQKYSDTNQYRWMLVYFREEDEYNQIGNVLEDERLMERYKNIFESGITLQLPRFGQLTHYYFGSSANQLKNAQHWFITPTKAQKIPAKEIVRELRHKLGNFNQIHNVATYVARVGLYLSRSRPTNIPLKYMGPRISEDGSISMLSHLSMRVMQWIPRLKNDDRYKVYLIDDIKRNGYCFTDGIGMIDLGLAEEVAKSIGINVKRRSDIPSAFQVRIAGCKGMLSICPASKLTDFNIYIRKSMIKVDSDDWHLQIVDYSRPMCLSLNNQIIRLLYDLNSANRVVIESLQNRCAIEGYWHPPEDAYLNVFDTRDSDRIKDENRRKGYCNAKDLLLKNKIPLPVDEARCLFGIADETNTLEEGQCFIQYTSMNGRTSKIVEGNVLVTKNPCLYPGDIRRLRAVNIPGLRESIRDCIVFPVKGRRPHFNEIAGSDLDGDQYWVYWGDELKVPELVDPLDYKSAQKVEVPEVTEANIFDYILHTMGNSTVGLICNTHSIIADRHPQGTFSQECKILADLFTRAIDSVRTGEVIDMKQVKELQKQYGDQYPSWMNREDERSYQSNSINGHLAQRAHQIRIPNRGYHYLLHENPRNIQSPHTVISINDVEQITMKSNSNWSLLMRAIDFLRIQFTTGSYQLLDTFKRH